MKSQAFIRFIIICLFFTSAVGTLAQNIRIEMGAGIGTYKMEDLKALNQYVQQDLPIKTETTANFPAYLYYRGALSTSWGNQELGFSFAFHSTGSRVSAADYSGEYRFDNLLKAYMPGIWMSVPIKQKQHFRLEGQVESGIIFSRLNTLEYFQLFDTVYTDSQIKMDAMNGYLEPSFQLSIPLGKIHLGCKAGYMLQFGTRGFNLAGQRKMQVANPATGKSLKPEWGGVRVNLFLAYKFKNKE